MDHLEEDVAEESQTVLDDALLVETVSTFPALYDLKLAVYHNTLVKARCWEMVSEVMNHSVAKCMGRWVQLKDSFRREKNKREKESRSGQSLSQRKGFSLYSSMNFMHTNVMRRKSFNNAKSSSAETERTEPGNFESQFTASATWETQYQCASWDQVPPSTSNYHDTMSTLRTPAHEPSSPVWMPSTTVSTLFPTARITAPPGTIDTCLTNDNEPVQIWPPANFSEPARTCTTPTVVTSPATTFTTPTTVNESAITFTTHTARTEPTIPATALATVAQPAETSISPTSTPGPMITSTATSTTGMTPMHAPSRTPSPFARARMPLERISTPNINVSQSSPHSMTSMLSFHNAVSQSPPSSSSPAPPSPADSVYSSAHSDRSYDFNLDDADTVHIRNTHSSTQRKNRFIPSPSASLSAQFTHGDSAQNKNPSSVTPQSCYNKDTKKKTDPLEACMISLSNSIKGKLEAEPAPKQTGKTSDQIFADMVAAELSCTSEEDKMKTKSLIVEILFGRAK